MAIAPYLIGGGLLAAGQLLGNEGDAGSEFLNKAYNEFGSVNQPLLSELQSRVEFLTQQGIITPEMAQSIMQDPSLMEKVTGSPEAQSAQMQALSQLQGISTQGGMTTGDKATLAEINAANAAKERGSREALAMNARERGVGGSGIDMVSQMINQQSAAGNENLQGLEVAKTAQQRALDAIAQSGQLGGQIEGQKFGEQSAKASAQDAINKFNAANRQNVEMTNVGSRNTAQAANLAEKQRVADTNIAIGNKKAADDAAARQTQFQNRMQIAAGKTGQLQNMATGARDTAGKNLQFQGQMIGTAGNVLANAGDDETGKKKWSFF
jgi:hypothetical protein